tara:strand:- start:702 stop:1088 length:387 start_codon:yes stop_codon:yes gene_type:complete
MAGTSTTLAGAGVFTTFCFFAAGALAAGAFFAGLLAGALAGAALAFDLLAAGDFDFAPFLAFSSAGFPFLVSAFFAPLAGVLEGFSALPVFLGADFEVLASFSFLASALIYSLVFFGLSASSAFVLAR